MLSDVGSPVAVMTPANLSRTCLENTNFVDFFGNDDLARSESVQQQMTALLEDGGPAHVPSK